MQHKSGTALIWLDISFLLCNILSFKEPSLMVHGVDPNNVSNVTQPLLDS